MLYVSLGSSSDGINDTVLAQCCKEVQNKTSTCKLNLYNLACIT